MCKLLLDDLGPHISILDGEDKSLLPEWAAYLIWLGAWCRSSRMKGKRLIVFAVLPTRGFAAAFAALGCLVAGANNFKDTLSWPTFRSLPIGHSVFWRKKNSNTRCRGNIVGFKEHQGAEFIVMEVTRGSKRSEDGSSWEISRTHFETIDFTVEQPPAIARAECFATAEKSLRPLVENMNPKWIWADGAEALLITDITNFESAIITISLSIKEKTPITMLDLLCPGRNSRQNHTKLRIEHPRGTLAGSFPLAILDGARAFMTHERLASESNMLVILDRSEYQEGIHNTVLRVRSIANDVINADFQKAIPSKFPPGIELSAYVIDE